MPDDKLVLRRPALGNWLLLKSNRTTQNSKTTFIGFSNTTAAFASVFILHGCSSKVESAFVPDKATEALSAKDAIPIDVAERSFIEKNQYSPIAGSKPDAEKLKVYEPIFLEEFSYYPAGALKRCALKRIVFCRDLFFEGAHLSALPDYDNDVFYLDVELGSRSTEYQRKVIHHEFFHIIDWKDDSLVYEDKAWSALNPPDFKYGKGGRSAQNDPTASYFDRSKRGFVTKYALSGVEEDKAETFANMMVNYKLVESRAKTDPVLQSKIAMMKSLLHKFDRAFDDQFWTKIASRTPVSKS